MGKYEFNWSGLNGGREISYSITLANSCGGKIENQFNIAYIAG